jgi:hypothetical protein
MAKRKQTSAPEPPPMPRVGDKVKRPGSDSILEITQTYPDGEVNLVLPGTNLEWFRVRTDTLTFVERKPQPKTSNPFTTPEPEIDIAAVMERIVTVQEVNLQRLDDDLDILKAHLKTQDAPKAAIEALEDLTVDHHKAWKIATGKIKKVLGVKA